MEQSKEKNKKNSISFVWDNKQDCTGCSACAFKCAHHAITMKADEEGFIYPFVDAKLCTDCGLCRTICPQADNGDKFLNKGKSSFYGGKVKDERLLLSSSSGGAFSAICSIFDENSIICGCTYGDKMKVVHCCLPNTEQIKEFRKSKYLQSDIGDCFVQIKNYLSMGKTVLFVGTSCQVAGLYAYLGNKPQGLITVDLICHGVPSQMVFDKYLNSLKRRTKTDITYYSFREKKYFWDDWEIGVRYGSKNKTWYRAWGQDCFMTGFLKGLFYRPVCYNCKYANSNIWRPADFTIGDFWGCSKVRADFHEKKGCSLIIANSALAKGLIKSLNGIMILEQVDAKIAIEENHNLVEPTKENKQRADFFKMIQTEDFETVIRKLYKGKARSHSQKVRVVLTKLLPWLVMQRRKRIIVERK